MEIIKNYLETMFQNMPNTEQVRRAKYELGQMMEDKYTELKNEGKTENEAIGTVIAEFGNLDELAEDLGISSFVKYDNISVGKQIPLNEIKSFISAKTSAGYMVALGVLLCIISPVGFILGTYMNINDGISTLMFFLSIALAVGLFVFSGFVMEKWKYLKKQPCTIDFATAEYVHNEKENYRMTKALFMTVGIMLCVMFFVPLVVMGELFGIGGFFEGVGAALMFIFVALGVFFIIAASAKEGAYKQVLKINKQGTLGAEFVVSQKYAFSKQGDYKNKNLAAVMSVYWPTVTCIYFCWSFLTMNWYITWIVWVIAVLVETFIKNLFGQNEGVRKYD